MEPMHIRTYQHGLEFATILVWNPALVSVALAVAIGVVSGALTSLAGAGGGTLSTAGVRATGTSPTLAIGSTIPAMLPSAVVGSLRYAHAGLVNWRIALATGGVGAVLAVVGAVVSSMVDAHYLMLVCAAILAVTGIGILRGSDAADAAADPDAPAPSSLKAVLVGGLGGFVAGLLGVGGGLIVVPAFSRILRMPLRTAVGSSLVTVAIISVPAVVAHSMYGQIDWRVRAGARRRRGARCPHRLTAGDDRVGGDDGHRLRHRPRRRRRPAGGHRGLVARPLSGCSIRARALRYSLRLRRSGSRQRCSAWRLRSRTVVRASHPAEQIEFRYDEWEPVLERMNELSREGTGWINLFPETVDEEIDRPPSGSSVFGTLFRNQAPEVPLGTWTARPTRHRHR